MTAVELVRSRVERRVATRLEWRALHRLDRVLARPPGLARTIAAWRAGMVVAGAVFVAAFRPSSRAGS